MKKFILLLLLGTILSACGTAPTPTTAPVVTQNLTTPPEPTPAFPPETFPLIASYPLLSPEDMRFDLDELFHRLETTHPDLYARRLKAEIDAERQLVYAELSEPMTLIGFYKQVYPLVASLGDFHTSLYLPDEVMSSIFQKELFIPLDVKTENGRAYITANYSGNDAIQTGAELIEINGTPASAIVAYANRFKSVLYPLWFSLWLVYGSTPEYRVKVILPGEPTPVNFTVAGLSPSEMSQAGASDYQSLAYTTFPGEKIGLLTINDFSDINQALKPAFTQIRDDGIQHLIIDIRANGGGFYEKVDSVMRYLTDKPYRHCSSYTLASSTTTPRQVDCEFIPPNDTPLRYRGRLYLLIGPDTLSGAITFATILQDHDLATLIGEKTADFASYCAFVSAPFPLPRTSLNYVCSTRCFIRPSGILDDFPVMPDFTVPTTLADRMSGNDPVLEYILDMIRKNP